MTYAVDKNRPPIMGVTHMVSAGHYQAATAGYRILEEGGNATDAGVASGIALNVTHFEWTSFGGVAPIIIYDASSDSLATISGLGRWPRASSLDYFAKHHGGDLPDGILRTVVPAAADAWLTALEKFGTMTFEQVVRPALELADRGYPITAVTEGALAGSPDGLEWPSTREVVKPTGQLPSVGDVVVQKDLARTFGRLVEIERSNAHKGREGAIRTARDFFYKGEVAEEIARFVQEQGGLLTLQDMKEFSVDLESPSIGRYKEYTIYGCGPWCQGPSLAQALRTLEEDDLVALGHNSADYIHLLSQAVNLAFSDREHFYGDPDFVEVPLEGLMSGGFARARRAAIDMERAFPEMPPPGDPWSFQGRPNKEALGLGPSPLGGISAHDTSNTCVVDRWGNAFSATPSDGCLTSPIVPGLGLCLSGRGSQSWLEPDHPSSLQPWKRPRLTPNPAIVFKNGKLFMPFGSPGGDAQVQVMLQSLLNIVEFGMDAQVAVEAPRFVSLNFPNSFWPHSHLPARLKVESRVSAETRAELSRRGHDVQVMHGWVPVGMGGVALVQVDQDTGLLTGGADPRKDTYAIGR